MPFYNVSVGFAVTDTACTSILSNGIPPSIYSNPVRVLNAYTSLNQTVFQIEAANETIANEWGDAVIHAIKQVTEFAPPVVENPDPAPTPLNVWVKVGTWTKSAGTGASTVSGLPSAPKGLIVWGSGLSGATMGGWSEAGSTMVGFSDGTTNRCLGVTEQDNVSTTNTNRIINGKVFQLVNPSLEGTNVGLESCTATFGATSFDLVWNATTLATTGFYFVFGGTDITSVQVKDYTAGTTVADTVQDYIELGDRYDFAMFMAPFINTSAWTSLLAGAGSVHSISVHAGTDPAKTWCSSIRSGDALTSMFSSRLQRVGKVLHTMGSSSGAQQQVADWVSWTAEGFKLKWTDPPGSATFLFTGLFVKGGKWEAGSFNQPTANGTVKTLLADPHSKVKGVMGVSIGNVDMSTATTGTTVTQWTIGAQDVTDGKGSLSYSNLSPGMPVKAATNMVSDKFMKYTSAADTASASTTLAECTISDMATDGEFTANFTTTDSTARQTVWFSLSA